MAIKILKGESPLERGFKTGKLQHCFAPQTKLSVVMETIRFAKEAVQRVMEEDIENLRSNTFKALHIPENKVTKMAVIPIQTGAFQMVTLVTTNYCNKNFITKISWPEAEGVSIWPEEYRPLSTFKSDFNSEEPKALSRLSALERRTVAPIETANVVAGNNTLYLYTQPYLSSYAEINPCWKLNPRRVSGDRFVFEINLSMLGEEIEVSEDYSQEIMRQVIRYMANVYLRSGKKIIPGPSLEAGDVMLCLSPFISLPDIADIRVVGMKNLFDAEKVAQHYKKYEGVPKREEDDALWFANILDHLGAHALFEDRIPNHRSPLLSKVGFKRALSLGLQDAYQESPC